MNSEKKSGSWKRVWIWIGGALTAVLGFVIAPLAVAAFQPHVERISGGLGPQLEVTVENTSYCDFVAPSEDAGSISPSVIELTPVAFNPWPCDEEIESTGGAYSNLVLELAVAPPGEAAIILTDITIDIRDQMPTAWSAYYTPVGVGGQTTTLTASINVEAASPVQEVTVYAGGTENTFDSIRDALPRVTATQSDPLDLILSFYGEDSYTTFDVVLHWQSGTDSGAFVLNNGGNGYKVAGRNGLPRFEGYSGEWILSQEVGPDNPSR